MVAATDAAPPARRFRLTPPFACTTVTPCAHPSGSASVASVAFLGPISRVHVTLADGTVVGAQMASSAARAFSPGDRVTVGVEPTGVLVIAN